FQRALRLGRRAPAMGGVTLLGVAGIAAAFVATLGWTLVTGDMVPVLAERVARDGIETAFALFVMSSAAFVIVLLFVSWGVYGARRAARG
ncbi:MAG: hypothetical protein AAF576_11360, partial [Pseudomonadota bacterium]